MVDVLSTRQDQKHPLVERKSLLVSLTFGHVVIHWYQQIFPIILPLLKADLGLTDIQVGGLMTAKQGASGVLSLPSGFMADALFKHRAVILGCALAMGGFAYLVASMAPTYFWILIFLVLLGAASALWHPSSVSTLSSQFSDRRGTALALHGVGASIGDSIGPLCIGGLLILFTWRDLAQWHLIPAVVLGIVLWKFVRKNYTTDRAGLDRHSFLAGVKRLLSRPSIFLVMLASSFVGMARLSVVTFLPLYLTEDLGYSSFWLGFHWALLYAMGMISQPLMGIISDKFSRKTVLLPSFATLGLLYLALPMAGNAVVLALIIAAMGMFFYGTGNIATAAVLDVASDQVQGTTHSFMSLFQQVFTLPAPIIAGVVVTAFGITPVFYYASALLLLAASLWLLIRIPPRTVAPADQRNP